LSVNLLQNILSISTYVSILPQRQLVEVGIGYFEMKNGLNGQIQAQATYKGEMKAPGVILIERWSF